MQIFTLPDLNDLVVSTSLDDSIFHLHFAWNDRGGYWALGVRDSDDHILIEKIKCIPNYPLLRQFQWSSAFPSGEFVCVAIESFEVADDGVIEESFGMSFDIDKDAGKETNKSKVSVFNPNPEMIQKLEAADAVCVLEAGYAEDIGLVRIFIGTVTHVSQRKSGADLEVIIELADGQTAIRDAAISIGLAGNVSGSEVIRACVGQMGMILSVAPDVEFFVYPTGFSFVGYARDVLAKVCAASGCSWSVQSNTLQIILNSGTTNQEAYVLAADSGLIESPERIIRAPKKASKTTSKKSKKTKKKEKYQKQAGWRVKSLLLPAITPGDLVRVESITITGWFKVESIHHRGGSYDNDFYTEMELIEVLIDE